MVLTVQPIQEGNPRTLEAVRLAELQLVNEIQPDKVCFCVCTLGAVAHLIVPIIINSSPVYVLLCLLVHHMRVYPLPHTGV